ncbi:SDR family NAD(P)-dependent oxidoreductase [Ramlibacter sp. USB13]|uniref:SDR family NAD(P)-dependent oxidoreductase n=1 Tax=Ramlibacter cellulosilyticus TaxID=2764187 RepID=A0A923SHV9_9BURK|nr:SDR family NAD(P)-dependent oxidoreductase [Ramlibacter cellulosilyticus]MBC5786297.1 SDR family NAD(P)-dependent oxidoreductase [Ramlibacter cellulosilyticus]
MNILIYGATSRIAHECARLWARQGHRLVLLGRDAARLEPVAADLRVLAGDAQRVASGVLDLGDEAGLRARIAQADAAAGGFDVVLVAHGWLPEQPAAQSDPAQLRLAVEANALSVAQLCEAVAPLMEARKRGTIAVIGSVAGDRGRQSNYIYGASKGFVERYCQGLRNRLHAAGVQVVLVKPGPTDTPMTRGMGSAPGRLASPVAVAADIVQGIGRGRAVVYTPGIWRWIMTVIRWIPETLFVRLKL